MDATLERLVRERAGRRCEYCRLPQAGTRVPLEIDHVIARKHRGARSRETWRYPAIIATPTKGRT